MSLFFTTLTCYIGILTGYRPYPNSLKATRPTVWENIVQIKASILLGVCIIVIFFFVSNFSFTKIAKNLLLLFGLNNFEFNPALFPLQLFTHLLIHENLLHLTMNVSGIALLSIYERRAGSKRFLSVLIISSIASSSSLLFYSSPAVICGISGGIFGLAAAYFTDRENMSTKEWVKSIFIFVIIAIIFTLRDVIDNSSYGYGNFELQVDYYGHILGAFGGVVYCRMRNQYKK